MDDAVSAFGGAAVLTSSDPINGTERCIEALELLDPDGKAYDVVINVQGDEPFTERESLKKVLDVFKDDDLTIERMFNDALIQMGSLGETVLGK